MADEPVHSGTVDDVGISDPVDDVDVASPDPMTASSEPGSTESGSTETSRASGRGSHRKAKAPRPFWIEAVVLLAFAMGIALAVHTFFFQAFYIPSGSMENTLHIGDRVLVNRMSYNGGHVQRGQIVVFNGEDSWTPEAPVASSSNPVSRVAHDIGSFLGFAPAGEKDFIKRVIGVPGDHVTCCNTQGQIMVNGKALSENYLYPGSTNANRPFDITVPSGRLWVEGDHRDDSADSRSHTGDPGGGTIPESKVIGRAFVIVWPLKHWRGLSIPSSFHAVADGVTGGLVGGTTGGVPYGVAVAAMLPVGLVRLRRRRRRSKACSHPT